MLNIIQTPSPNFNDVICNKLLIVIHWTAGGYFGSLNWLCSPMSYVSSHFIMNKDGSSINQLVDMHKRAWHAGHTGDVWHPICPPDMNAATIGIECEGPPSIVGLNQWQSSMVDKLVELCIYIKKEIPTIVGIVDHSSIEPLQKYDVKRATGKDLFPWDDFIKKTGMKDYSAIDYTNQIRKHFGMSLLPVPNIIQTSTGNIVNTSTGAIK